MIDTNGLLAEVARVTLGGINLLNTAGMSAYYVSMKTIQRLAIIIVVSPASGTDTSVITLLQATTIENSPVTEKTLAFTTCKYTADAVTNDTAVDLAVTGNAITTSAAAKTEMFVIDVNQTDLDLANGFTSVRANLTDPGSVSTPTVVLYIGYPDKYARDLPLALRAD